MPAKRPSQPPVTNQAARDKLFTELCVKVLGKTPPPEVMMVAWKQWVESSGNFDGVEKGGLRDVEDAAIQFLNDVKRDLDDFRENVGVAHNSIDSRLDALEAASSSSFP